MNKYRYMTLADPEYTQLERELQILGDAGWRLVSQYFATGVHYAVVERLAEGAA